MQNTTTPAPSALDPRAAFDAAVAAATPVIAAVTPDQLTLPTPCHEMDVDLLLGHLVMVVGRVAAAGRAVPPSQWPDDLGRLGGPAALEAWRAGVADAAAVWRDDALLTREIALPWNVLPGAAVLGIYTNEIVVHAWDLAQATGRTIEVPDAVLEVALAAMHAELPTADRAPMWAAAQAAMPAGIPWADPFANAVDVPADAPLLTRVVAWSGRRP